MKSLERLRKNQEELAQRAAADARRARDEVVERRDALIASLVRLAENALVDVALAASLDDARARVLKEIEALGPVIETREAELDAALAKLRTAARDRQATQRLIERRDNEVASARARQERKDEDEQAKRH